MLEVEHLTKRYGSFAAVKDITFKVERGEILGFLGPNGAGKTTTMRVLTCFMPATEGTARVAGFDIFEDSLEVRKRVGYLPESVPLYREMPVRSYLNFVAEVKGVPRKERARRVHECMEECGIADRAGWPIGNLSKGLRQRVGLAQALVHNPEVLILDEPTLGLDPKQIVEIRQLIKSLGAERTVVLSTHILPEVSVVCNRVIIINEGKLVAVDTPENLTLKLQEFSKIRLRVEGPHREVVDALGRVDGVVSVVREDESDGETGVYLVQSRKEKDVRNELARAVTEHRWGLLELSLVSISLEEVFVRLVTEEKE
jgi:ABC-2 type transport system ATP-binding protein